MLSDFFEDFVIQNKVSQPDGMGGVTWSYTDGVPFKAGISLNNSSEAQIAYKNGLRAIYTIVCRKVMNLKQDDVVKRTKDGRLYRITSNANDMETPAVAVEQYHQVTAEVIEV